MGEREGVVFLRGEDDDDDGCRMAILLGCISARAACGPESGSSFGWGPSMHDVYKFGADRQYRIQATSRTTFSFLVTPFPQPKADVIC